MTTEWENQKPIPIHVRDFFIDSCFGFNLQHFFSTHFVIGMTPEVSIPPLKAGKIHSQGRNLAGELGGCVGLGFDVESMAR
jgi:hypothetical protein